MQYLAFDDLSNVCTAQLHTAQCKPNMLTSGTNIVHSWFAPECVLTRNNIVLINSRLNRVFGLFLNMTNTNWIVCWNTCRLTQKLILHNNPWNPPCMLANIQCTCMSTWTQIYSNTVSRDTNPKPFSPVDKHWRRTEGFKVLIAIIQRPITD